MALPTPTRPPRSLPTPALATLLEYTVLVYYADVV